MPLVVLKPFELLQILGKLASTDSINERIVHCPCRDTFFQRLEAKILVMALNPQSCQISRGTLCKRADMLLRIQGWCVSHKVMEEARFRGSLIWLRLSLTPAAVAAPDRVSRDILVFSLLSSSHISAVLEFVAIVSRMDPPMHHICSLGNPYFVLCHFDANFPCSRTGITLIF